MNVKLRGVYNYLLDKLNGKDKEVINIDKFYFIDNWNNLEVKEVKKCIKHLKDLKIFCIEKDFLIHTLNKMVYRLFDN